MSQQRVMTSAIEGVSVAEVRKALQQVRDSWRNHSDETPICISEQLSNNMSIEDFAFRFSLGHHYRRHQKSASGKKKTTSSSTVEPSPPP